MANQYVDDNFWIDYMIERRSNYIESDETRSKSKRKKHIGLLALIGLLFGAPALANYVLSDGSTVSWSGDGNTVYVQKPGDSLTDAMMRGTVSATENSDGRLVPTFELNSSQLQDTTRLGSQNIGGDSRFNQNTAWTIPVYTNGQFTGYSNLFQDSSGLGRTFYTQNNSAGSQGSRVIDGANGSTADYNWTRVDLTSSSPGSSNAGSISSNSGGSGSYTPPRPTPLAPPKVILTE